MEATGAKHPYYPRDANIPGYVPSEASISAAVFAFGGMIGSVIVLTYVLAARRRLSTLDRFTACWFAVSGFLHTVFENYYIFNRTSIPSQNTLFAQLWKEYTLSDSRYLTSDVFTVCVETITVFAWGPLSILCVISILRKSYHRHFFQIIVCTAHLYGVILYYATNWAELQFAGVSYSRPEFLYFWIYYFGCNLPWAIVPLGLLYDSFCDMRQAFAALHEREIQRKTA